MQDVSAQQHYAGHLPEGLEPIDVMSAVVESFPDNTPKPAIGAVFSGLKYILRMGLKPGESHEKELRKGAYYFLYAASLFAGKSKIEARKIATSTISYFQNLHTS